MKEKNKSLDESTLEKENLESALALLEYFTDNSPDLLEDKQLAPIEQPSVEVYQSGGKAKPIQIKDPYAGLSADDLVDVIQSKQNAEVQRRYKNPTSQNVYHYTDGTSTPATRSHAQTGVAREFTNPGNKKASQELNALRNKEVVKRREERVAGVKKDGGIGGNTALGAKLRLYPKEASNFVDEYLNIPAMIGDAADNFNDKMINRNTPESTLGEKAMATAGLGLSLAGGVAAKTPLGKVNQLLNPLADIPLIPNRRRILPDAFDISTLELPGGRSGMKGYNSFVHAKGRMSESYGDLITKEFPVSHNADLTPNLDVKPYRINVDKAIQGNQVQDALYQSNLDFMRQNSKYNYIRTGDDLLSAPATQKFHDRSIVKDIPKTGDVHTNERTGEMFFMPVREYYGSKNPNVINDVIARLNKLPKHETTFKSLREVVEPQVDKLKQRFTPTRSTPSTAKVAEIDDNPFNLSRTDKPGVSLGSIRNAMKHIDPIIGEALGRLRGKGGIEKGQTWFNNWIDNPISEKRILTEGIRKYHGPNVDFDQPTISYVQEYRPQIKHYPIKNQVKDMYDTLLNRKPASNPANDTWNTPIHVDNSGVSYRHYQQTYSTLDRLKSGAPLLSRRDGSWVSAAMPTKEQASVGIHELTHDYYKNDLMKASHGYKPVYQEINPKFSPETVTTPKEKHLKYLAEPTEVHARIMQLRQKHNLNPGELVTEDRAKNILKSMSTQEGNGNNLRYILEKDPNKLKNLLNRMWTTGAVVGGAAIANENK